MVTLALLGHTTLGARKCFMIFKHLCTMGLGLLQKIWVQCPPKFGTSGNGLRQMLSDQKRTEIHFNKFFLPHTSLPQPSPECVYAFGVVLYLLRQKSVDRETGI